ncbi:MAG: hypothetical protein ACYC0V_03920 [Armatimonadota bacterium]
MQLRIRHNQKLRENTRRSDAIRTAQHGVSGLLLITAILILIFSISAGCLAGTENGTASKSKPIIVAASASDARTGTGGRISLDFVSSDIHDVLKALAMQGGVNIVTSPDVKGNITVSLSSVTVEEALKLVVNLSGYKYEKVDGVFIVGTTENMNALRPSVPVLLKEDKFITASVAVRYTDLESIKTLVKNQFPSVKTIGESMPKISSSVSSTQGSSSSSGQSSSGNIQIDILQSLLVLYGPEKDVEQAKAMVQHIDQSMSEISDATDIQVVEIKYANINEVVKLVQASIPGIQVSVGPVQGFNLTFTAAQEIGTGENASSQSSSSNSNSSSMSSQSGSQDYNKPLPRMLILKGDRKIIEKAKEFIAEIDVQVPQIMIEAKVLEINSNASKDLGIDWEWDAFRIGEVDFNATGSPIEFGIFHRSPVELRATVNALAKSGNGRILANPNVLALDGKPSSIVIGDKVIYVKSVLQGTNGPSIETGEVQVGIQLHSISTITSDGYITMALHPEVSVITAFISASNGVSLPQIANRFVDSTIRVKDGETIVLGGLIKEDELHSMSGIPLLRDLPIIGQFFGSKTKSKTHSEIMIFITPRIMPLQ